MDEADEDDDPPAFPLTLRIAGWVWVGAGVAFLAETVALIALAHDRPAISLVVLLIPAGLGCWLGGCEVIRGETAEPLAGGVVSVTLGVPVLGALLSFAPGIPI